MRLGRLLAVAALIALASPALATISIWQNDAGTGGDASNVPQTADHLWNRQGGQGGAYAGELYRALDESDWYFVQVAPAMVHSSLTVSFVNWADPDTPCASLTNPSDLQFVEEIWTPMSGNAMGTLVGSQRVDLCYSTGSITIPDAAVPGKWLVAFLLVHPNAKAGEPLAVPASTYEHERYAFDLVCQPAC
jgi:hypothetical protein